MKYIVSIKLPFRNKKVFEDLIGSTMRKSQDLFMFLNLREVWIEVENIGDGNVLPMYNST